MSHTSRYEIKGFKEVVVIHDGDWDGEVEVMWEEDHGPKRVHLPAALLRALGSRVALDHARSKLIECIESLESSDFP